MSHATESVMKYSCPDLLIYLLIGVRGVVERQMHFAFSELHSAYREISTKTVAFEEHHRVYFLVCN